MIETGWRERPLAIRILVCLMLIGPPVTYSSTIWTDSRKISSVIVGVAVLWLLTYMVWRGSSVGAWLLTVFSGVGLVVNNLSSHSVISVWWVLRVVLPLIAVILMWAPRESRSWLMRPCQPEHDWLADDTSLPDGHGSVAVLIERPTGAVAVFWKDSTPQVVLDEQQATAARWGTNRYVLTVGPHHLRVDVTSPFPELAQTSGSAQRQLIIEAKSEIRLVYVPPRAPTLQGHLVPRKAPSSTAKR